MKITVTLESFCPDVSISNDMEELCKYIDVQNFKPSTFWVSRYEELFYWYLTFNYRDKIIVVSSQYFGNLHYLLEDIAKLSHELFAKYYIELPFPDNLIEKPQ